MLNYFHRSYEVMVVHYNITTTSLTQTDACMDARIELNLSLHEYPINFNIWKFRTINKLHHLKKNVGTKENKCVYKSNSSCPTKLIRTEG